MRSTFFALLQKRWLFLLGAGLLVALFCLGTTPAHAQIQGLTRTDIGSTGVTGTYSYSSGTYTVGGGGLGPGGGTGPGSTSDAFTFVSTTTYCGTEPGVEMVAQVNTQTNTGSYAFAGLMFRSALNAGDTMATIGVSPQDGVKFITRDGSGSVSVKTLGPTVATPVWLRLVRSGDFVVAGYESSDNLNWTFVGSFNFTTGNVGFNNVPFQAGFAVASNVTGTLSTATFNSARLTLDIPQVQDADVYPACWICGNLGVVSANGKASAVFDQAWVLNHATQPNTTIQPSYTTNALNGMPVFGFNGSTQYFKLPTDFVSSNFSLFAVINPSSITSGARIIDVGNGTASDNVILQEAASNGASLTTYNGSTPFNLTAANALTANVYQLLEAVDSTHAISPIGAALFANGALLAQNTSPDSVAGTTRSSNFIGQASAGGNYFAGKLAEMIVFFANPSLDNYLRGKVENYIYSKYGVGSVPTLEAPSISPPTGSYSGTQTVSINSPSTSRQFNKDPNGQIFYTTDGSTPTHSSTLYTGSFQISSTKTVKAIMARPYFNDSPVATSVITIL